jgi:hypothetical protein
MNDLALRIRLLLENNPKAVERAILALYARQTQDEQSSSTTKHSNGRGFSAFEAKNGTYYAKWILSGRSLTGHHLDKARTIGLRHIGQLVEVAQEKAAKLVIQACT